MTGMKNWMTKLFQSSPRKSKPMPYPDKGRVNLRQIDDYGRIIIDRTMSEDTARQEENKGVEWQGHGNRGMAYLLPNGNILKYTTDPNEVLSAQSLIQNPIPCVVDIYSVTKIQEGPVILQTFDDMFNASNIKGAIWGIEMEKVIPMTWDETSEYEDEITAVQECLVNNGYSTGDASYRNLGWTKDGNLVLFDLGYSWNPKWQDEGMTSTAPIQSDQGPKNK
jgi:hypothetical protein